MRVRLTVMLDLGTMTALEIERLRDDMRQLDFASGWSDPGGHRPGANRVGRVQP